MCYYINSRYGSANSSQLDEDDDVDLTCSFDKESGTKEEVLEEVYSLHKSIA